jgi:hypothetical protein
MPCPSDGLVTKLRHYTTPVKWVMPARRAMPDHSVVPAQVPEWESVQKTWIFCFFSNFLNM